MRLFVVEEAQLHLLIEQGQEVAVLETAVLECLLEDDARVARRAEDVRHGSGTSDVPLAGRPLDHGTG